MSDINVYEIYTKNPETGESGWDIKYVASRKEHIENFPHFDCVITTNDKPAGAKVLNWIWPL